MRKSTIFFKPILCAALVICFAAASAQNVKFYTGKADESYNKGEYEIAISNYSSALKLDPDNTYAYNGRGLAYTYNNQLDLAIQDFNKAIQLDPNYSIAYVNRGYVFSQHNQLDFAIADYTKAISLDPDYALAYNGRGNVKSSKKQYDLAIQDLTKAITLDPEYPNAFVDRGIVYNLKNQYDLGIQDFTKAISLDPEYTIAYANRGYAYAQKKQYELAIKDYTKAIELDPEYTWAYSNRGYAYSAKNQFDFAIQDHTNAINLDPEAALPYVDRGIAYGKINQYELAITDYTKAITLAPKYTWAYINRGYTYRIKKLSDLAIQDYTTAISLEPGNSRNYSGRGFCYSGIRQYDLAIQDFSKAISLGNKASETYAARGYALSMKYQYEAAVQDMTTAINTDPGISGYYSSRGFYYNYLGKYAAAIQDYKTCLEKDPNNVYPYINIISPLLRLRRLEEASSYYTQYQQKKLTSYIESPNYKFYKTFITAVTQASAGKLNEAMASLDIASKEYGMEIKEETKRGYIDILFLRGYIQEKLNKPEEAKIIFEQSLVIDPRQPDLNDALQRLQQKQTATRSIDKEGPEITLISPAPSRGFEIEADNVKTQIIGKAKDVAGISVVKINNIPVDKVEDDGLFLGKQVLKSGSNSLVISATDKQGNTTSKTFIINTNSVGNTTQTKPDQSIAPAGSPNYFAILIAEKDYEDPLIPDLQNPVKDAKELKAILESKYTFLAANIDTLYNRSREDIMQAIVQRCNTLTENDNLLIFYAGHGIGEKDKFGDVDGYWIPVSARKDLNASYISADDINKAIKRSNAKHILVIADACFSGAFTRSLPADAAKEIKKQYAVTSRKVMASGNLEPVPDNSKFLFYLKKSLTENQEKYITAKDLFDSFYKAILSNSDNLPQYAAIKNVGDEGGEFIFIKK